MKLLEQLTQTAGISGREHRIRELIQNEVKGLFDEVKTDTLGSLICVRHPHPRPRKGSKGKVRAKGAKPLKVMIAAHMDQIGFMVRHIDEKGFLRVTNVGGFDTRNLFARLCTVCPDIRDPRKDLQGVMNPGARPIHVATEEEKKKIPTVDEFAVDLGLPAAEVKRKVKIGDMVVLHGPSERVGKTFVSQCLDNRVACWIAIRAVQELAKLGHGCELYVVFTSQEEVGLRGALTSAFAIEPDVGIAVDVTLAVDTPGVPDDQRITVMGGGAALDAMNASAISDLDLLEQFQQIGDRKKIKVQRLAVSRGGTDSGAMQRARCGSRTLTLSCPTRYVHTVTEMVHEDDLAACRDLLAAYLAEA